VPGCSLKAQHTEGKDGVSGAGSGRLLIPPRIIVCTVHHCLRLCGLTQTFWIEEIGLPAASSAVVRLLVITTANIVLCNLSGVAPVGDLVPHSRASAFIHKYVST
jgi:hypothetical protein